MRSSNIRRLITIRDARSADIPEIMELIYELAIQEGQLEKVEVTPQEMEFALFDGRNTPSGEPYVFVKVAVNSEANDRIDGFVLFLLDFPTWLGRHGIYIEDICVRKIVRGQGIGTKIMKHLAQICIEKNYSRIAWWVYDSNVEAVDFYAKTSAEIKNDYTVRHLVGEDLIRFAHE
jgi:GNAT superfamily N-acetyltransferase